MADWRYHARTAEQLLATPALVESSDRLTPPAVAHRAALIQLAAAHAQLAGVLLTARLAGLTADPDDPAWPAHTEQPRPLSGRLAALYAAGSGRIASRTTRPTSDVTADTPADTVATPEPPPVSHLDVNGCDVRRCRHPFGSHAATCEPR